MELFKILRENVNTEHPCHEIPDNLSKELEDTKNIEERWSRAKTLILDTLIETETNLLTVEEENQDTEVKETALKEFLNIMKLQSNIIESHIGRMEKVIKESEEELINEEVPENAIVNDDTELPEITSENEEKISESISKALKECVVIAKGQIFEKSIFSNILESLDDVSKSDVEIQVSDKLSEIENNDEVNVVEETYSGTKSKICLMEASFNSSISLKDIKSLCLENFKALKKNLYALREAENDVEELVDAIDKVEGEQMKENFILRSAIVFNKKINSVLEHTVHLNRLIESNAYTAKKYVINKRY